VREYVVDQLISKLRWLEFWCTMFIFVIFDIRDFTTRSTVNPFVKKLLSPMPVTAVNDLVFLSWSWLAKRVVVKWISDPATGHESACAVLNYDNGGGEKHRFNRILRYKGLRGWMRGGWRDGHNGTTLRNHMTRTWCMIFRWTRLLNWLPIMEKHVMLPLTGMARTWRTFSHMMVPF